jgi:hypothetical protein
MINVILKHSDKSKKGYTIEYQIRGKVEYQNGSKWQHVEKATFYQVKKHLTQQQLDNIELFKQVDKQLASFKTKIELNIKAKTDIRLKTMIDSILNAKHKHEKTYL